MSGNQLCSKHDRLLIHKVKRETAENVCCTVDYGVGQYIMRRQENISMKLDIGLKKLFALIIVSPLILPAIVHAEDLDKSSEWKQRIQIYGWFPSVDGTLNYEIPGTGGSVSADASDLVDNLQGVFMGAYEARKQKWSFKGDIIYLSLSNSDDHSISIPGEPTLGAQQDMKAWILGLYGGYNIYKTERLSTDILVGVRYLSMDVDATLDIAGPLPPTLPSKNLSDSLSLWDGLVGVKGEAMLSDKWHLPYHFDVGVGSSDLTWQALVGVGYRFNNWGSVVLAYRHLEYDQGKKDLLQDVGFSGPALGIGFHF